MANRSPDPVDKHLGSRVRMHRMTLKMSQKKLGEALGVTFQQVQKYERGINRVGAGRLQQIAHVLQVPVAYFFEGAPQSVGMPPTEFQEAPSPAYVTDFLATFMRIPDAKLRRRIVQLLEQLVVAGKGDASRH